MPAVALRRARPELAAERFGQSALECCCLTRTDGLRRLGVQSGCGRCRSAPVDDSDDLDSPLSHADADLNGVSGPHLFRRLDAYPVDVDAPAEHRLCRGAARLEEPRR